MAQVDPRQVYDTFFAWNESTTMTLLDNGVRRGQISIAGGSGEDPDTGEFVKSFSLSGLLEHPDESASELGMETDLFWRGLLDFSDALHLMAGEFSVRIPKQGMTGRLKMRRKESSDPVAIAVEHFHIEARATLAGNEIFAYDSEKSGEGSASPIPFSMLPMQSMIDPKSFDPSSWQLENEARSGSFTIGGREVQAYLVSFRNKDSEGSVRVFFSEVGEPLRIETDIGIEAVSEILVPLDAYLDKKEKNES